MLIFRQIQQVWEQLSRGQRTGLIAGGAVILLVAVLTTMWAGQPRYEILFANLESTDAGRIVDELRAMGQSYRITDGGRSILVPRDKVYDLRLRLASMGVPSQGTVGYEIFDKNSIGMTDFVQRLNYQRALEGELARTIEQLDEVEYARIHVVMPEPTLYADEEERTTASVLVRVSEGRSLAERQVQGIRNLVAAGVEGLVSDDVTVVDAQGKMLGRQYSDEEEAASSQRVELQRSVESYLANKALGMLEGVLGPGKALVQVNAELDFEKVERTIETYDGDNPVVRSLERSTRDAGEDSGESVVTNYEISRTVEHVIGSAANLKRISVAVMVDGLYVPQGEGEGEESAPPVYQPRPADELTQLRGIIENAVGIDAERGDRVSVECFPFDKDIVRERESAIQQQERMRMILDLANKFGIGLLIVLILWLSRNFIIEARRVLTQSGSREEVAEMAGIDADELKLIEMQNQIHALVDENPERVAHLVRAWLHEGKV
jgi:flagellar M-ring protein FliF